MLTQENVRELFDYDPETGIFTRLVRVSGAKGVGSVVGCRNGDGYLRVRIKGPLYFLHRLAFLYMNGYLPENQVDHKNGVVADNRWENLREVSRSCNMQNQRLSNANNSGYTGVSWDKRDEKWHAQIKINKKTIHLGLYKTATEAAIARVKYEDDCPAWTCNHQSNNRVKLRTMGII